MNPDEYERLVADICSRLNQVEGAIVEHKKKLVGASGQEHEIDVAVTFMNMGVRFLTLLECKYWDAPVGMDQVMVLAQRVQDIGASKGILVTKVGFQKGAFKIARAVGIALVLCKDCKDKPNANFITVLEKRRYDFAQTERPGSSQTDIDKMINTFFEDKYSYYIVTENEGPTHIPLQWFIKRPGKM